MLIPICLTYIVLVFLLGCVWLVSMENNWIPRNFHTWIFLFTRIENLGEVVLLTTTCMLKMLVCHVKKVVLWYYGVIFGVPLTTVKKKKINKKDRPKQVVEGNWFLENLVQPNTSKDWKWEILAFFRRKYFWINYSVVNMIDSLIFSAYFESSPTSFAIWINLRSLKTFPSILSFYLSIFIFGSSEGRSRKRLLFLTQITEYQLSYLVGIYYISLYSSNTVCVKLSIW